MKTRQEVMYDFMLALASGINMLDDANDELNARDIAECISEQAFELTNVYFEDVVQ